MIKFKEEFRDVRISIPALRLEVNRFNVNTYGEMIMKKYPKYAHMLESPKESGLEVKPTRSRTRKMKD